MNNQFYAEVDGKFAPIGKIESIELDEETEEFCSRLGQTESFKCEVELKAEGNKNPNRLFMSGFNKGYYNGLTLKEDGYLSPENGWVK